MIKEFERSTLPGGLFFVGSVAVILCGERGTQPVVNTGTIYR